jgi:NodT family efflux transporter outer membrane factor (OMF) lipoprotein
MSQTHSHPGALPARPLRLAAWCAAGLLGLAGCAQIPEGGKPAELKTMDQLASRESLAAPGAAWPEQQWWKAYGDSQLDQLIDEALRDSPTLTIAQARLQQAGALAQAVGAAQLPEVTGTAGVSEQKLSYNAGTPRAAMPNGWNDYGQATVNLSWELDFWGKNRSALAAATSEEEAAKAEVAQTRLVLSTAVAAAWAELQHLYTVRDSAEAALALRDKTVDLFHQRYDAGLENLAGVRQVEARRAVAQVELVVVDERIALHRNAIAALLGAGPDRGLAIQRPTVDFAGSLGLPPNIALDLLGRRPDIVAARLRTEAAAKRIDERKAGFYPSVNLMAFAGVQSLGIDNLTKSGSDIGNVGAAISLPIFNTARLQGGLRAARADYDASVAAYNGTLSHALREVADAVTSRKALEGELAAAHAAVDAAAEAHRLVTLRYRGELATYLDVLSAEDALISARRALAELETRALVLDVALVRSLGGGYATTDTAVDKTANPQEQGKA